VVNANANAVANANTNNKANANAAAPPAAPASVPASAVEKPEASARAGVGTPRLVSSQVHVSVGRCSFFLNFLLQSRKETAAASSSSHDVVGIKGAPTDVMLVVLAFILGVIFGRFFLS
jgi:hypothetical protein